MTAALCHRMGLDFGPREAFSPAADRFNPVEYFQRADIVRVNQTIVDSSMEAPLRPAPASGIHSDTFAALFDKLDMSWLASHRVAGLKDPRFSLTLPLWLGRRPWGDRRVHLIRGQRNLDSTARSAMRHHFVSEYCDGDFHKARALTECFDQSARRLCEDVSVPVHVMDYDRLLQDPVEETAALAAFLGRDRACATHAAELVGKKASMVRHYGRKVLQPRLVLNATGKTLRAVLRSRRSGPHIK